MGSDDDSTELWNIIEEFQKEHEHHNEYCYERQKAKLKYVLARDFESSIYCDTINKLIATGRNQKTLSEFSMALIHNQHHFLCCLPPAQDSETTAVAATIEPYHEQYMVTRDKPGDFMHQKDSTIVLVHELYYTFTVSLLQLLFAIHTTYKGAPYDFVMFDTASYVTQDQEDATKLILTGMGKWLVKVIPPYKELQINDSLCIGVTKKQLGDMVASESAYVDAPGRTLFFNFWSPKDNSIRFENVTKCHNLPRVYFIIPYFGNIYLQGEKGHIKRLVEQRFGMRESEFETTREKARSHSNKSKSDHGNHFVQVQLTGAGANTGCSYSICARQAFSSIVKDMEGDAAAIKY